uniref:Uncharacterized protein n=1 Tax=Anguilla anguilla TaxID=7936 RepID=A0A0E9Q877_ANGAN
MNDGPAPANICMTSRFQQKLPSVHNFHSFLWQTCLRKVQTTPGPMSHRLWNTYWYL